MGREIIVPGQKETSIETDLIREGHPRPFVSMVITGPENALCLRLNEHTMGDLIRRLQQLKNELRELR